MKWDSMTVRDAKEELVTVIKVWGDELSTNCLKNTTDSSTKTSAQGTAAIQTANKMFGHSVSEMVNNAENILPLYQSFPNSPLAYCPCPSPSSKRSCRNKRRSESKNKNKQVGSGGRGRDYHRKRLKRMRFVYLRKERDKKGHSKIKYQML